MLVDGARARARKPDYVVTGSCSWVKLTLVSLRGYETILVQIQWYNSADRNTGSSGTDVHFETLG